MTDVIVLDQEDSFEDHCWHQSLDSTTQAVYAHYRRQTYLTENWALVVVDPYSCMFPSSRLPVTEAIRENPRSCGEFAWDARAPMLELLATARNLGVPVVMTTARVDDTARTATNRPRSTDPGSDFAMQPGFEVLAEDTLIVKEHPSAFFDTKLADHLRGLRVTSVVLAGATTSGCLRATAVDASSHGFHTVIVEDAVFDRSRLNHEVNLFDLHHKYADVVSLGRLTDALKHAGTN